MSTQRFRDLVKRLHPDTSGDGRTVTAFRRVIEAAQRRKKRFSKCFCGVTILAKSKHCRAHSAVRIAGALTLCLGLMASGATLPPMPPAMKKRPVRLSTPRGAELYSATPMAVVLPEKTWALTWDYPLPIPRPGVQFVIESRHDSESPWLQIGATDVPPFTISTGAPKAFFRVGTKLPP